MIRAAAWLLLAALASCPPARDPFDPSRINAVQAGQGTPPVVFENGLGATLDTWGSIYPEVARQTAIFAYDRPGLGGSAPVASPRDAAHVVDELRAALKARGLAPPYILVGHSLGGIYMQYFARRFPGETAGLVLVDSTNPAFVFPPRLPWFWPGWLRASVPDREYDGVNASASGVMGLPVPAAVPVIVMTAWVPPDPADPQGGRAVRRSDVARMYPGSRQIWVDGGHWFHMEHPQAVIDAIGQMLQDARGAKKDQP